MKRHGFERTKRTATPRLIVEVLESRRVMAGLEVSVFQDQDGSRSQTVADLPAANRLVYVDLNRDGRFADGEPLAVSDSSGVARFANLPAGEYWIALAGKHAAQVQTTSVSSSPAATPLSAYASQRLLASEDLSHAWAISGAGQARGVGANDPADWELDLGGPVLSATRVIGNQAWALIDQGQAQPALVQVDLSAGTRHVYSVSGMLAGRSLVGISRLGDGIALQQQSASGTWLSRTQITGDTVVIQDAVSVPAGRAIDSADGNRLALLDTTVAGGLSMVSFRGAIAEIQSVPGNGWWREALLSPDGKWLIAAAQAGGVEVFSTQNGLKSLALLAEATGPMAISPRDGRLTTGNGQVSDQLIVWDTTIWQPISRTTLPEPSASTVQPGSVLAVAVDEWGQRLIAVTKSTVFAADMAVPTAMVVKVPQAGVATARVGVRLNTAAAPLPKTITVDQSVVEDQPLELNLRELSTLAELSASSLYFAAGTQPGLGQLAVQPTGRLTYLAAADRNGSDHATIEVYDGISSSTLVLSLTIDPQNDPPTELTVQSMAIAEAAEVGTVAGLATVFDVDTESHYWITTNDERFVVVDGQLLRSANGLLDYETEPLIELELTATDRDDWSISLTRRVLIPVLDSNDGPSSLYVIPVPFTENSAGCVVGNVVVVDPDGYDRYVYSVSDDRFEVVGGQLRLKSGVSLDRETEAYLSLSLRVYDAGAQLTSGEASVITELEVLDDNDLPESIVLEGSAVQPGKLGAVVGVVDVIDQDILDTYSFVVSDSRFEMDGNVLRLKSDQKLVPADGTAIPILVTAQDGNGVFITQSFTVNIVNDVPGQNPTNPMDVDNDGHVSPRDVLILINALNDKGPHAIEPLAGTGEGDGPGAGVFIDVNGDGMLTALDALILINQLNNGTGMAASPEGESAPLVAHAVEQSLTRRVVPLVEGFTSCQAAGDDEASVAGAGLPAVVPAYPLQASGTVLGDRQTNDTELELLLESLSRERLR